MHIQRMSAMVRRLLLCAALVVPIAFSYRTIWHSGFIWDDDAHLTASPCIVGPLGLKEVWTTPEGNYFPLVLTHFWVLHKLWGLNPLPYHAITLLMHLGCAFLLWNTLSALGVRGAWLGAALWSLHPVQAESVAWVSESINTQSGLFFLLSVRAFVGWLKQGGTERGWDWRYGLACLCAACAITSKPSTVMLPAALALCWWWLKIPWRPKAGFWLLPFVCFGVAMSGWTIFEQKFHSGALGPEWNQSMPERLIIAGRAVWFYLFKLIWPHPLIFIYPRWTLRPADPISYLPAAGAAVCIIWLIINRRGAARPFLFAAAFFVALLFPVLGFFSVYFFRYSFVSDHFQYLASMGPLALIGAGIATAALRAGAGWPRLAFPVGAGIVLATLAVLTSLRAPIFASNTALWEDTLRSNPLCWMAHNNLAVELAHVPGREAEALAHTEQALRINPDDAEAQFNLAVALDRLPGRRPDAIAHYEQALRLNPKQAHWHLKLAYDLALMPGRRGDAIGQYLEAVRIDPNYAAAHYDLGVMLEAMPDHLPEAIGHYEQAVRIAPDFAPAHFRLAMAYLRIGKRDKALEHLRIAAKLDPAYRAVPEPQNP
jgi:protein O-mannosyl-transferase